VECLRQRFPSLFRTASHRSDEDEDE
jgi:hypothetical protein